MIKKIAKLFAVAACVLCLSGNAFAITVAGDDYTEFLTLDADGKAGYWVSSKKFMTWGNQPVGVDVDFIAGDLQAYEDDISRFHFMGTSTSARFDSNIRNGTLTLFGEHNQVLLSASYASNGTIDSTRAHGNAGQLDIMGLYTVTGGVLRDLGLVQGTIFAQFLYDTVTAIGGNDLHVTNGTIRLYRQGGGAEVPEPASMVLLASSLLGAARFRRKKSE